MAPGGSGGTGLPIWRGRNLVACSDEDLVGFSMWSGFLPRGASERLDHNAAYVKSRGTRNKRFFDETRERLVMLKTDFPLRVVAGVDEAEAWAAMREVLHAQGVALGFACDRQFRKALILGELCIEICDLYAEHHEGLLFWQMLCRLCLGAACARFKQIPEAKAALGWVLEAPNRKCRGDSSSPEPGGDEARTSEVSARREIVLMGASHAHLCTLHLDAGEVTKAATHVAEAIQVFEEHLPALVMDRLDRADQGAILATIYANQGVCDVRQGHYDEGLVWYAKARSVVAECPEPEDSLMAEIARQVEHAEKLKESQVFLSQSEAVQF